MDFNILGTLMFDSYSFHFWVESNSYPQPNIWWVLGRYLSSESLYLQVQNCLWYQTIEYIWFYEMCNKELVLYLLPEISRNIVFVCLWALINWTSSITSKTSRVLFPALKLLDFLQGVLNMIVKQSLVLYLQNLFKTHHSVIKMQ